MPIPPWEAPMSDELGVPPSPGEDEEAEAAVTPLPPWDDSPGAEEEVEEAAVTPLSLTEDMLPGSVAAAAAAADDDDDEADAGGALLLLPP